MTPPKKSSKPAAKAAGSAPAPTRLLDLDAARAARLEAAGEPVVLRFAGIDFTLPPEMPLDFALATQVGDMRGALVLLLGEKDFEKFLSHRPSLDDYVEILEHIDGMYGMTPGEAKASAGS